MFCIRCFSGLKDVEGSSAVLLIELDFNLILLSRTVPYSASNRLLKDERRSNQGVPGLVFAALLVTNRTYRMSRPMKLSEVIIRSELCIPRISFTNA